MTSVFFFLHQRPIRAKQSRVVYGRAGVPEGYLSPEGLSAGMKLAGEVSREEGGRSKLWTRGDITATLRRTRWGAERRPSPRLELGPAAIKLTARRRKWGLQGCSGSREVWERKGWRGNYGRKISWQITLCFLVSFLTCGRKCSVFS